MPEQIAKTDGCRWGLAESIHAGLTAVAGKELEFSVENFFDILERPREADKGDYAFPCFRFARPVGKKPQDIAQELAGYLNDHPSIWIDELEVVGAFLNIRVKPENLARYLLPKLNDDSWFQRLADHPEHSQTKVMIEYSQPNTHKVFHVGHMRNVALGDSLWRIYEYCGYPVVPVNYIGDEGTHIAKCLWYIRKFNEQAPANNLGEWLGAMYTKANIMLAGGSDDEKKQWNDEVSEILAAIESKKGEVFEQWQETRQWSLDVFKEIYKWLGARFDFDFYESAVSEESQSIVDEYLAKGVFKEDDGAIGVDLKAHKAGFALLRKRDGNTLYATKDLALARSKYRDYDIDRSVYVVGSEQILHFKQVFKVLELMGFEQAKNCFHMVYGHVLGPDGKMSSRAGNIIPFSMLKEKMLTALEEKLDRYKGEWSQEELTATAHKLSVGAIRYGMVCSDPIKEIVFDIDQWLDFSGDTGPYLMYSFARAESILRNGAGQGYEPDFKNIVGLGAADEEKALLKHMYDINDTILSACRSDKPSILAHGLFDMCKDFSRFHKNISVLKAESDDLIKARLTLVMGFRNTLKQGLALLGISPPERM
mgnify:CR=1 FL=1